MTPGDPYMLAIQEPNVDVHFTAATKCTEDGIVGGDGVERKCDTIICATGSLSSRQSLSRPALT
jgi:hydroxyversicolorone monooxygenase